MTGKGGEYRKTTVKVKAPATKGVERELSGDVVHLDRSEWKKQLEGLAEKLGGRDESLPVLTSSRQGARRAPVER